MCRRNPGPGISRGDRIALAAVLTAFAVAIAVVDPRGNVPLNDDWNFALATWWFSEHGVFRLARATAMSLRGQIVWGSLWTFLFGRSFEVLRASTLGLALVSLLLLMRLLRLLGVAPVARTIVVLALLFHPIFFWSSFTYMTEVPFVTASIVAFYFFVRGHLEDNLSFVAAGCLAVILSCLIRQTGIANLAAPLLLPIVLREGWMTRWRAAIGAGLLTVSVFLILLFGTPLLVGYPEEIRMHYAAWQAGTSAVVDMGARLVFTRVAENYQYAAIFFLPLVWPLVFWFGRDRKRWALWLFSLIVIIPVASARFAMREPMPYRTFGNVFVNLGLGPLTLRDTWAFGYRHPDAIGFSARVALTIVAVAGAGLILAVVVHAIGVLFTRRERHTAVVCLGAVHGIVSTLILAASPFYFDRYAIDALWSVVIVAALAITWTRPRVIMAGILVASMALCSLALTGDYLSWNRARWDAFRWLRVRDVTLAQMDGGYEINQYLIGGFDGHASIGKFQFSVIDDEFILTFNEVRGYRTIARFPYPRLARRDGLIFVQERTIGFEPRFDLDAER